MEQTAVKKLELKLLGIISFDSEELRKKYKDAINQAKEMEKEQIMDAFWNGDNTDCLAEQNAKEFAEQYYNETFKLC